MAEVSTYSRRAFAAMMLSSTAACGAFRRKPPASNPLPEELPSFMDGYGPLLDAGFNLPGIEDGLRRDFTLEEYRGRRVVLAFYPGDFTFG